MSDMTVISENDLIESVADALQYISYYHPMDYIRALGDAYEAEKGPAAKDAIAQILTNSRMCAEGHRPICQDTGIVNVFVKWGMNCRLHSERSLQEVVDEGVRRAYNHPDNKLRASILADPAFTRRNTRDNTPCVLSVEMVPGNSIGVDVAAKGGGSENKSKFKMMNPSDNIVDWVLEQIPSMGAGWCPPGMLGIGIGGTAEHCMKLAKQSLMDPIDMGQLKQRGAQSDIEQLRIDIFDAVNAMGVGAQGLGGLSTVLDVKILDAPCHAAGKPVAMIPNCAATRHAHFTLDGSGPAYLEPPRLDEYPQVTWKPDAAAKRVDLDALSPEEVASWQHGDRLLLSGKMLTGRDAAHKRIKDMLDAGEPLPVDFKGRASSLIGATRNLGQRFSGRSLAGILIFSDGNATDLESLSDGLGPLPPIYPVVMGKSSAIKDISITLVQVTASTFEDAPVTIRCALAATGFAADQIEVRLLDPDGTLLETQRPLPGQAMHVEFEVKPEAWFTEFYGD